MQLHEILENGPIVYAAPVGDNKLGEVYNLVNGWLMRYIWVELPGTTSGKYMSDGRKMTHTDYDATDIQAVVEQAELWHNDIQAGVDE